MLLEEAICNLVRFLISISVFSSNFDINKKPLSSSQVFNTFCISPLKILSQRILITCGSLLTIMDLVIIKLFLPKNSSASLFQLTLYCSKYFN